MEKGGRQGGRINMRTAILSHEGMEGSHFLLPFSESENEDQRSGFPNDDLTHSLFFGVPAAVSYKSVRLKHGQKSPGLATIVTFNHNSK
jgi:hypothetical protein